MTFREFGSRLQGHPTPEIPWVDVATGSLGQGLPIGVGIALAGKYLDKLPYHVWVLCGDSEMAEGSIWEAFDHAGHYRLNNLIGILDMNRLGQRGETELGWNSAAYAARARAFGWHTIEIDGRDAAATRAAYGDALKALGAARPDVIGLDGEVSNSTYAEKFAKAFPERFFEMYIAEQQMVAAAVGLSVRGYVPF